MTLGSLGTLTISQARARACEILGAIAKGEDPSSDRSKLRKELTISELGEKYLAERQIKPLTKTNYEALLRLYIGPHLGQRKISAVTRSDVQSFYKKMVDNHSESRGVLSVSLLRAMFSWAKLEGLVEGDNPAEKIQTSGIRKRERYLSADERSRLWGALDRLEKRGRTNRAALDAIRMIALTGARKSAITCLEWSEVDLERAVLNKREGDDTANKGAKRILLSEPALEILRRRFDARDSITWVFPATRDHGKPCTYLAGTWKKILEIAEIENFHIHDLRHSFASDGLAQGLSLQVIGILLGHKSTSTTARYAHLADDAARAALAKVSEEIERRNQGSSSSNVIDIKKKTS